MMNENGLSKEKIENLKKEIENKENKIIGFNV